MITKIFTAVAALLLISTGQAVAGGETWSFTAQEIEAAYKYQENHGERLRHPLKPNDCREGKTEFRASYQGVQFTAPCSFVREITRHLKEILELGAAKHIFPLDVGYARLAVPSDIWKNKYSALAWNKALPAFLSDPSLIALYYTAGHLESDPKTAHAETGAMGRMAKRTVLASFDGKPIVILPPNSMNAAYEVPAGYELFVTVQLLAQRLGEMEFLSGEKPVVFDMSFDDDSAIELPQWQADHCQPIQ